MRIVVDAMGSDNFPAPDVEGAVIAARDFGIEVILTGDKDVVQAELDKHEHAGLPISVVHASQAISMTDKPSSVGRTKKDSSMHVGMRLVRDGEADGFVSMGNTGAALSVAMLHTLKRIRGVKRPALGVVFPVGSRPMLIDNGANADCRPEFLLQFARMGAIYMERMYGIERPKVALISNGEEEGKGNSLVREVIPLLAASGLNYIGNIEPKEFIAGEADVAVTDGFTGNIIVKTTEAIAGYLFKRLKEELMSSTRTKVGALLAKPAFKAVGAELNPDEIGGVPMLGVNGVVIIGHGRSGAYAVSRAILQAKLMAEKGIPEAIRAGLTE